MVQRDRNRRKLEGMFSSPRFESVRAIIDRIRYEIGVMMRLLKKSRHVLCRGAGIGAWLFAAVLLAQAVSAQDVVTHGAVIGDSPMVNLEDALQDVDAYSGESVILKGTVVKACPVKGCWMELVPNGSARGIRVTFKDYGFFVPTDSAERSAKLEGVFESNVFSKHDADHLIAEGVRLTQNSDGTATELSFVASGVELWSPASR